MRARHVLPSPATTAIWQNQIVAPHFNALGIAVSDLSAAIRFYELLGLEFPDATGSEGHVEALLGRGFRLMLDTEAVMESFDPSWAAPSERGRIGLAFACDDSADVDVTYERLIGAGHRSHLAPFDAFWGQRYAAVLDPDGNVVDLFASLEVTEGDG
jgi:uncharacterized glyoxalase superfamily protein PhnB